MNCAVCGKPSMVLNADYKKFPFQPNRDVKRFCCGNCVGEGRLGEFLADKEDPENNLRNWRNLRGVSQTELARVLGVSRSMVCQVESGAP